MTKNDKTLLILSALGLTVGLAVIISNRHHSSPKFKASEIRNLLAIHTTVESWGTPCITKLARLMESPVPKTRQEKIDLIKKAEKYVNP